MNQLKKIIEYLFYLFIFLLPWQTRWIWHYGELNRGSWEYGTFAIYGTEILLLLILILVIILKILNFKTNFQSPGDAQIKIFSQPHLGPICLLLIFALFSIIWSHNRSLVFYYWTIFLEGIFIFLLINQVRFSFEKISYALVFGGGVQAIFGIWQFFSQQIFASKWLGIAAQAPFRPGVSVIEQGSYRWLRAYGGLSHPNILGGFLVIVILLLLILILNNPNFRLSKPFFKQRANIIGHYLLLAVCLIGLGLTFSRGAWIALFMGLLALIWRETKIPRTNRRLEKELIIIGLVIIIIFSTLFCQLISGRFQTKERLEIKSFQGRLTGYQESLILIKKHPINGVGLGNYTETVWREIDFQRPGWEYQPVHNLYLLIWAELGIIGLILFLVVIFKFLKMVGYFLPLIISLLTIGFFDHYFWSLYFGVIFFWLILGLGAQKYSQYPINN